MKYKAIIEVTTKEWFDKANGNSYFASRVVKDDDLILVLPRQYGYGNHSVCEAVKALAKHEGRPDTRGGPYRYCEEQNYKLIYHKYEGCTRKEVEKFGTWGG